MSGRTVRFYFRKLDATLRPNRGYEHALQEVSYRALDNTTPRQSWINAAGYFVVQTEESYRNRLKRAMWDAGCVLDHTGF